MENTTQETVQAKSFKMDKSKAGNRRTLLGIAFIILLRLIGQYIGYILAGAILGALFWTIEYYASKNKN